MFILIIWLNISCYVKYISKITLLIYFYLFTQTFHCSCIYLHTECVLLPKMFNQFLQLCNNKFINQAFISSICAHGEYLFIPHVGFWLIINHTKTNHFEKQLFLHLSLFLLSKRNNQQLLILLYCWKFLTFP